MSKSLWLKCNTIINLIHLYGKPCILDYILQKEIRVSSHNSALLVNLWKYTTTKTAYAWKKIAKLRFQRSNYLCLCAVVHSPSLTCEVRELNEKKYWIGLSSLLLCRARTCIFWQISTKKNFVNGFCYGLFLKDFIEIYWIKTMESAYSKF